MRIDKALAAQGFVVDSSTGSLGSQLEPLTIAARICSQYLPAELAPSTGWIHHVGLNVEDELVAG
jgi:hypothetical protein